MLRVGLTGGIGAGKSTVSQAFREVGLPVVDADLIAREVVAPGTPGLAAITERFGAGVLLPDGALDRPGLAAIVFGDATARADLNAITHPAITTKLIERMVALDVEGARAVVADLPLLVEMGVAKAYDAVVVVAARPETCVGRLVAYRGMARDDALARIAAQAPLSTKLQAATHILWNEGTLTALQQRAAALGASFLRR